MDWLPISEAPMDGTEIVVTDFASPPQFARWAESHLYVEGGCWLNRDGRHRELPTHYINLPSVRAAKS